MNQIYQVLSNKSKSATVILLSLFFVVMASCPIQKLITGDLYAQVETPKQPKTSFTSYKHQATCSLTDKVVKESFLSSISSSENHLNPLFLTIGILGGTISLFKGENTVLNKQRNNPLASSFPLFLKYRVLII